MYDACAMPGGFAHVLTRQPSFRLKAAIRGPGSTPLRERPTESGVEGVPPGGRADNPDVFVLCTDASFARIPGVNDDPSLSLGDSLVSDAQLCATFDGGTPDSEGHEPAALMVLVGDNATFVGATPYRLDGAELVERIRATRTSQAERELGLPR